MLIRDENIIKAQQELDELEKFRNTYMLRTYDLHSREHGQEYGEDLLDKTISKKRKELCELYIDKMKRYIGEDNV